MLVDLDRARITEEHKLVMRVLEIVEYGNLDDLKRINEFLSDNGLAKAENKNGEKCKS